MRSTLSFNLLLLLITMSTATLLSCKKNQIDERLLIDNAEVKGSPIPAYPFDWETATYVPSTSGSNPLQLPWNSGSTAIDANIVSDYRSSDGWVMVWNTFSPTIALNDPSYLYFFALYNKYRGVLRFYLWQQATPIATSFIDNGLSTYGTSFTSSMLNFASTDIIDPSVNLAEFHQMQNSSLNASGGTWLVFQNEIAYDPNIATTTFPGAGLTWKSNWSAVSTITINGAISANIKGYIGSPTGGGSNFSFGSILTKGALAFMGSFYDATYLTLIGAAKADAYQTALTNAGSGIIKDFFNAIIPKSAGMPVTLTMNGNINLSGNIVSAGALVNRKFILPGQSNSQTASGNSPLYDDVMGIFNLANKPTVIVQRDFYTTGPWEDPETSSMYYNNMTEDRLTLVNNTVNYQWNPAIINSLPTGTHYENLKTQIVALSEYSDPQYFSGSGSQGAILTNAYPMAPIDGGPGNTYNLYVPNSYGTTEIVGKYGVAVSLANSTTPLIIDWGALNYTTVGVRVTFDVVPNNGTSPASTIVKTFLANVQYQ